MKKVNVLFSLFSLLLFNMASAQTATGGCTSIALSNIPPWPAVYINASIVPCADGGGFYQGCDQGGRPACCGLVNIVPPLNPFAVPRYWLEFLDDDGIWRTIRGPQAQTAFNNVGRGMYRVRCQAPVISETACGRDKVGNVIQARRCLFNTSGQFLAHAGRWGTLTLTNEVIVGATTLADISYTFIDPTPNDPIELAYDFGEIVKMNAAACGPYDLWNLFIEEMGTNTRHRSNGWQTGRMPNDEINLTNFWQGGTQNWEFETSHAYRVQFVVENSRCRNAIEQTPPTTWNNLDKTFFICPAGAGCRTGEDSREVVISPNPASTSIRLHNFEQDFGREYKMNFSDLVGRLVKSVIIVGNEVDISDLAEGMFILSIQEDGRQLFSSKLIVSR